LRFEGGDSQKVSSKFLDIVHLVASWLLRISTFKSPRHLHLRRIVNCDLNRQTSVKSQTAVQVALQHCNTLQYTTATHHNALAHCPLRFEGGDSQKVGSQLGVLPLRCTSSKILLLRCTTFKIVNCDWKICVCVCLSEEFSTTPQP